MAQAMAQFDLASLPKTVAIARIGFGAQSFLTPKLAAPMLGARVREMTPAAMGWAGLFASREMALGALTLGTEGEAPAVRKKVLMLNAFVDAVDVASAFLLSRRARSVRPLLLAPVAALSAFAYYQAAQQIQAD